jgi:trimethylamine---corrinoid protein Co-methyltransferase
MARGKLQFLSKDEIERVHNTSIRVLEQVGVAVHSEPARKMLCDAGAALSKDGKRVLISEQLVKECLAATPKSIVLAAREPSMDLRIPTPDQLYVSNGGEGVHIRNLLTGESKTPTTEDVRNFALLGDSVQSVDFIWHMVGALDQPAGLKGTIEMKVGFESTMKHIQSGANDALEARNFVKLASILTGGQEELRKRPIFSCVQCPISPLIFDKGLTEAQVEFARAGVPVVAMVASVAGLTSPVTLSGSIAQINSENLASMVISQTASKGAPWIFSSDSCPGDLRNGSIDYGALESILLRTGTGQMGRFYGLPTMTAGIDLEGSAELLGSVREGVPHMALMGLVPSDLGSGLGSLDQAAGASYEQYIVDAWVWDVAKEFVRDFEADDSAISFDTIREAGLDGNFLGKRHTLGRFKAESAAARKPEAVMFGRGDSPPRGQLIRRASEEVKRILSKPRRKLVSAAEETKIDELLRTIPR